jgi:hypothetical protein
MKYLNLAWASARACRPHTCPVRCRRTASTVSGAIAKLKGGSTSKDAVDMTQFPPERIRNISIIAHIDVSPDLSTRRIPSSYGMICKRNSMVNRH